MSTATKPAIADKRTVILDTMLSLITTNGFHATPMSLLAQQAGVSAGIIYHYFDGKETLINELYVVVKQRMGNALLATDNPQAGYQFRFFHFWQNLYTYFIENPKDFYFLEQYANSPYILQQTKENNQQAYLPVILFLEEGRQQGLLKNLPVELITALTYGAVVATAKLHLSGDLSITPMYLQAAVQASWDSVKAEYNNF